MQPMRPMPSALLFACTMNAVRSPMAAALMRHLAGRGRPIDSVGVRAGGPDPLAAAVMDEIGLAIGAHRPRRFEDLEAGAFGLIIALSPEARQKAMEMAGAASVEYWPTFDPTMVDGSREQRLAAYRMVRDQLLARLKARFPVTAPLIAEARKG
jgi:protein-tyrosine-phosphatase